MSELLTFLSGLEISDILLCAAAVVILDLFALSVILAANRESKLCRKRWQRISSELELRIWDKRYPLEADEILLGRHISADIRLSDNSVSRYHAVMTVSGGVWSITDLSSKGGTFVNERRVRQAKLSPGDCIRLGNVQLYLTPAGGSAAKKTKMAPPKTGKGGTRRV